MAAPDVVVVGAGVIGLSVGVLLAEAGLRTEVWAAATTPHTTSDAAAALWYPYRALPQDLVTRWAATTYGELTRLVGDPAAGVLVRTGTELFAEPAPDPWWRDAVPDFGRAIDLPPGYADGYRFAAPVGDMSRYLPWLMARLAAAGATLVRRTVTSLDQPLAAAETVVNCTGLGARALAPDSSVVPIRGQVVVVSQVGVDEWLLDGEGPGAMTYVIPRIDDIVVGGSADIGRDDDVPDPAEATAILARATVLVPQLAGATVLRHKTGLRPSRPAVRLERDGRVVHCYGHGGAGVTLSWGCAADVRDLVMR